MNILPPEIWQIIISYLDIDSLLLIKEISIEFADFYDLHIDTLLRSFIKNKSKLNTGNFSRTQLIGLCQFPNSINNVSVGGYHSLVLTYSGKVHSFGYNLNGQLGLGTNINTSKPTPIKYTRDDIIQISAGHTHSLFLTADRQVYSCGKNHTGQLGLNDYEDRNIPCQITNLRNIIQISAGEEHSLILTADGYVYGFGSNEYQQLGSKNNILHNAPIKLSSLSDIKQVSAGTFHSLALTNNNRLFLLGFEEFTQLFLPNDENIVQIAAGSLYSIVLTANGNVYSYREILRRFNTNLLLPIQNLSNIISISVGSCSLDTMILLAINKNNKLYCLGDNNNGQLGLGDNMIQDIPVINNDINDAIQISAGSLHCLVLTDDHYVYAFGYNKFGQLGLGDDNMKIR